MITSISLRACSCYYLIENNLWSEVLGCATQRPRSAIDELGKPEVGDLLTVRSHIRLTSQDNAMQQT